MQLLRIALFVLFNVAFAVSPALAQQRGPLTTANTAGAYAREQQQSAASRALATGARSRMLSSQRLAAARQAGTTRSGGYLQRAPLAGRGAARTGTPRVASQTARRETGRRLSYQVIDQRLRASTVRVSAGPARSAGFIATRSGLIVTAGHSVGQAGAGEVTVALGDGPAVRADVVAYLPAHDIAVLRPIEPVGGTPVEFGDDGALRVGTPLVAYGHPHGETETLTRGIVNAGARRQGQYAVEPGDMDRFRYRDAIQTDAPTAPGSSGGPVATRDGRVVGLVSGGSPGTGMIVPARHILTALRLAERASANGRTAGAWPPHPISHRTVAPTERENESVLVPAHPSETSRVTVRTGENPMRITETRPDGRTTRSVLTQRQFEATHEPMPSEDPSGAAGIESPTR